MHSLPWSHYGDEQESIFYIKAVHIRNVHFPSLRNEHTVRFLSPICVCIKGALSGLRQLLVTESPLKMMKNARYFTLWARFVLNMFKFLSWLFSHVEKRLDQKDKVNFKIYDVTAWGANNCNIHIVQYLKK